MNIPKLSSIMSCGVIPFVTIVQKKDSRAMVVAKNWKKFVYYFVIQYIWSVFYHFSKKLGHKCKSCAHVRIVVKIDWIVKKLNFSKIKMLQKLWKNLEKCWKKCWKNRKKLRKKHRKVLFKLLLDIRCNMKNYHDCYQWNCWLVYDCT